MVSYEMGEASNLRSPAESCAHMISWMMSAFEKMFYAFVATSTICPWAKWIMMQFIGPKNMQTVRLFTIATSPETICHHQPKNWQLDLLSNSNSFLTRSRKEALLP